MQAEAGFPPGAEAPGTYAVLARVSPGYPPLPGRLSTCYSPVRRSTRGRSRFRARLACVKHAASVHSEPGSNSPVWILRSRHRPAKDRKRPSFSNLDRSSKRAELALAHPRFSFQRTGASVTGGGSPTLRNAPNPVKSRNRSRSPRSAPNLSACGCCSGRARRPGGTAAVATGFASPTGRSLGSGTRKIRDPRGAVNPPEGWEPKDLSGPPKRGPGPADQDPKRTRRPSIRQDSRSSRARASG